MLKREARDADEPPSFRRWEEDEDEGPERPLPERYMMAPAARGSRGSSGPAPPACTLPAALRAPEPGGGGGARAGTGGRGLGMPAQNGGRGLGGSRWLLSLCSAVRLLFASLRTSGPSGRDWGTLGFGGFLLFGIFFSLFVYLFLLVFVPSPRGTHGAAELVGTGGVVFKQECAGKRALPDRSGVPRLSLQLRKLSQFPCSGLPGAGMAGEEMASSRLLPLLPEHRPPSCGTAAGTAATLLPRLKHFSYSVLGLSPERKGVLVFN